MFFDRELERAISEDADLRCFATRSFRKEENRYALAQPLGGLAVNFFDTAEVAPVEPDVSGQGQRPADERYLEQDLFGDPFELHLYLIGDHDIAQALVIGHDDIRAVLVDILSACDFKLPEGVERDDGVRPPEALPVRPGAFLVKGV